MNSTPRLRRGGGIASSSFIFYLYWYSYIEYFVTQLPSLERWALLPFGGFPTNLLLVFLNLLFFRNLYHIFLASDGTFSGSSLFYRYFSVPYFGLACDHGNSFLCLEE